MNFPLWRRESNGNGVIYLLSIERFTNPGVHLLVPQSSLWSDYGQYGLWSRDARVLIFFGGGGGGVGGCGVSGGGGRIHPVALRRNRRMWWDVVVGGNSKRCLVIRKIAAVTFFSNCTWIQIRRAIDCSQGGPSDHVLLLQRITVA